MMMFIIIYSCQPKTGVVLVVRDDEGFGFDSVIDDSKAGRIRRANEHWTLQTES